MTSQPLGLPEALRAFVEQLHHTMLTKSELLARLDVFAKAWEAEQVVSPPAMFAALLLKLKEECESQHDQVIALTAERDALKVERKAMEVEFNHTINEYVQQCKAGDTARAALREALEKYGSHKNRCYALDPFRCSCGFDQVLAASAPERKETNPCPVCGTFLWGDTRPCWNCARAASAPERTT